MTVKAKVEGVTLAVFGKMNPAIHHPAWYRFIDAITAPEEEQARTSVLATPSLSRFACTDFVVSCSPDQWQVELPGPAGSALLRGATLAEKVFDFALKHTPVSALVLTISSHLPISGEAGPILGRLIAPIVGVPLSDHASANVSFATNVDDGSLRTEIQPSVFEKNLLYIAFRFEHRFAHAGPSGPLVEINLRQFIDARVGTLLGDIERRRDAVIDAIKAGQ